LTWFQTSDQWFSAFNEAFLKDSSSPQYLCFIFKRDYHEINKNGNVIIEPSMFIQQQIDPTEVLGSSPTVSPEIIKKKIVLYDYLVTINEHIIPGDFDPEPQIIDQASTSKSKSQTQEDLNPLAMNTQDYMDKQDN
jgi:hypothetical protein